MKKLTLAIASCTLIVGSNLVLADADIAVQPAGTALTATTNVDLCVVVPQVLIFGVGATGDAVAKLQWTIDNAAGAAGNNQSYSGAAAPFTAPAPFGTAAVADIVSNGGSGTESGNQADLPVFLFSNSGADVTITTTVAGGATGAGTPDALDIDDVVLSNTIPIADFTGGQIGTILHPALSTASTAVTAADTSGIVNALGTWTYAYTPSTIPASGTYEARVTYVASTP